VSWEADDAVLLEGEQSQQSSSGDQR
jgi:hypothetical protein